MGSFLARVAMGTAVVSAAAPALAADFAGMRTAIDRIAHLEELCTQDPARSDCSPERLAASCTDLHTAVPEKSAEFDDVATDIAYRLVRFVAGVMVDSACGDAEDRDAIFRTALLDRQQDVESIAARFKKDLDRRARSVGFQVTDLSRRTRFVRDFAGVTGEVTATMDGRTMDAEDVEDLIEQDCRRLPEWSGQQLLNEYATFHERFDGVPAARYSVDNVEAQVYNRLAEAWEVLLQTELCAPYAPVADSWRVARHTVEPGRRLELPEDPPNRLIGTAARSDDDAVTDAVNALRKRFVGEQPAPRHDRDCVELEQALSGKLLPALSRIRAVSRSAPYGFLPERARLLALMREAYLASATLVESCGKDVDPTPWRDDYVRSAVEFVRLLDPAVAPTLSRYLDSRYDVDLDREP